MVYHGSLFPACRSLQKALMPTAPRPPITLIEYERLFRVIHGVLAHTTAEPAQASLFFAIAGAFVLKRQHKLQSVSPAVGAAGYALPAPARSPLLFGLPEADTLQADDNHHHCWIEADGWIIDLYAPLFDTLLAADQKTGPLPARMFQRQRSPDTSLAALDVPNGALHRINERLTTARLDHFASRPSEAELVRLCALWYARPPKKLAPALGLAGPDNITRSLPLSPLRLTGAY